MTKKSPEDRMSARFACLGTQADSRRVELFAAQMREKTGGEFTRSDAIRMLIHAALDRLQIKDPGVASTDNG